MPYIQILRPSNVLLTFASVMIILLVARTSIDPESARLALLASLSAALIGAAANVINDVLDVSIDRINKPERVLPSGRMSVRSAVTYSTILSLAGLALSAWINVACFLVALLAVGGLLVYSSYLKRTPLWGNLTVSFFTGLAFIYGGIAIGAPDRAVVPAAFAFLFHLAREILKDMEDVKGDRHQQARTLPLVFGMNSARSAATAVLACLVLATWAAWRSGYYTDTFLWIVVAGVYPVLVAGVVVMWKRPTQTSLHRLNNVLKADIVVGIGAIYFGS